MTRSKESFSFTIQRLSNRARALLGTRRTANRDREAATPWVNRAPACFRWPKLREPSASKVGRTRNVGEVVIAMKPPRLQPIGSFHWRRRQLAVVLLCASACGGKFSRPDEANAGTASAGEAPDAGFVDPSKGGASGAGGARPTFRAAGAGGVNAAGAPEAPAGAPSAAGAGDAGSSGGGTRSPSCQGLSATCGPASNEDCCASRSVPGGSYIRRANGQNYPATVSDFALDRYEITVGRFRRFLASYSPEMM